MAEPQCEPAKTLDSPSSATDLTQSAPQPLSTSSTVPGSGTEPSEAVGTLARNVSFSKLNAEAPAFVPGKPPPAARVQDPRILVVPPPTPPSPPSIAAGMVHVYAGAAAPPPPFHMAVPPPPNHLHPHIHHHQQHMQYHNHHHQPHGHGSRRHHHHHHQHQQSKHHNQFVGGGGGEEREVVPVRSHQDPMDKDNQSDGGKNELSEDSIQKILNQVEYYFSDVNLATTDHLIRFIKKDPEGYVSMSVVASFKKIKALISSHSQLAAVLRSSTKLVVSEDGKKVKRVNHLTVSDMEELQSRIIVAENLPEDHCYQNLIKIFSAVGSVKSIRTCLPQAQNATNGASRSLKQDNNKLYNTKVHAFVEYETVELAEKAVAELNDEGDWRNGLRVRLLHNNPSKSQQSRGKRAGSEGEEATEEEGASTSEHVQIDQQTDENSGQLDVHSQEQIEEQANDKEGGQKKGRSRNRGRGRGSRGGGQNHHNHHHQNSNNNNRGHHHIGSPPTSYPVSNNDQPTLTKQLPPPGPRMPDGTRGFSMGRGKPLTVTIA